MAGHETSRRDFLKAAAITGAGLGVAGGVGDLAAEPAASVSDKVPRRQLGRTGVTVPILVLGGSMKFDPKYDKVLHRAFGEGIEYLDTALSYADGESHRTIAPFVKQIGDRKKLWITSKGGTKASDGSPGTPGSFTMHLETCLQQLETDYLDLFFMHAVDDPRFLEPEFLAMGDRLRTSGKTRFFGFSCHGDRMAEVMRKAATVKGIDAIMFRYSFAKSGDRELEREIDACHKAGIGLIAMKTQDSVPSALPAVKSFKSKDFTLAQAKLKAVWADERIAAAVSHMDNTTKLAENVAAAKSPTQLAMSDFLQLQRIAAATAGYSCQGCSHLCESAYPGPAKIAQPLRYLMYHECYGDSARARAHYQRLRPEERDLASIDLAAASARCPQGIDLTARLARAAAELA